MELVKTDEEVLQDFLLDIECLDELNQWTSKFNLFDVLKISKTEIRHSNMLAWLFDPNENHGTGDQFLKGIIQRIVQNDEDNKYDVFRMLLLELDDFVVYREWRNIDLLMVSEKEKILIAIENKVLSKEHSNQLERYRKILEKEYPGYERIHVFLTPDGEDPSDVNNWCILTYVDVVEILEAIKSKMELIPEVELMINNYIEIVRRDIVEDAKLIEICNKIYVKHRRALDLIYENRPDRAYELSSLFRRWAIEMTEKGELSVDIERCTKKYTRFRTNRMSNILPNVEELQSGWKTKSCYFYEIVNNDGKDFNIQFVVCSHNIPEELRVVCDKINSIYPSKTQKLNWIWRIHFKTDKSKISEDISENELIKLLEKKFDEVKKFEDELLEYL